MVKLGEMNYGNWQYLIPYIYSSPLVVGGILFTGRRFILS